MRALTAVHYIWISGERAFFFLYLSLKREHLRDSTRHSVCPWKNTASYFDVVVDNKVNPAVAWYYPEPKPAAAEIREHVAFWQGVTVQS